MWWNCFADNFYQFSYFLFSEGYFLVARRVLASALNPDANIHYQGHNKPNNKNILIRKTYFETSQRIPEGTGASHLSLTQQETMKVQRNPRILLKRPTGIVFTGPWMGDICFYSFIFLTRWLSCKKIQGQQTVFPVIITWTVQANNTSLPVYQLLQI